MKTWKEVCIGFAVLFVIFVAFMLITSMPSEAPVKMENVTVTESNGYFVADGDVVFLDDKFHEIDAKFTDKNNGNKQDMAIMITTYDSYGNEVKRNQSYHFHKILNKFVIEDSHDTSGIDYLDFVVDEDKVIYTWNKTN